MRMESTIRVLSLDPADAMKSCRSFYRAPLPEGFMPVSNAGLCM